MEELPTRSINLVSNLEGFDKVFYGMREELTLTLDKFEEDDHYTITWYTSFDSGETFEILEGIDGLSYRYKIDENNAHNIWKVVLLLTSNEE